jgi:hypothetical protein
VFPAGQAFGWLVNLFDGEHLDSKATCNSLPPLPKGMHWSTIAMHRDGLPYRLIGRNLGLSKNTVMKIIKRGSIVAAA